MSADREDCVCSASEVDLTDGRALQHVYIGLHTQVCSASTSYLRTSISKDSRRLLLDTSTDIRTDTLTDLCKVLVAAFAVETFLCEKLHKVIEA